VFDDQKEKKNTYKVLLIYRISYRILYRMKVTAIIPDDLIDEVRSIAKSKNLTESLIKALSEWISIQNIRHLNSKIDAHPLKFKSDFNAKKVRDFNRS